MQAKTQSPNKTQSSNIVHEAEVQRQHMRVQLPIKIELNSNIYEVADWSHQGIAIYVKPLISHNIELKQGTILNLKLHYDFNGFSLVMPIKCEVRHLSSDGSKAGCRFNDLDERSASLLQYLVSAYVAGDMVHVGDVLDVVSRKNFTTARKLPASTVTKKTARKMVNFVAFALIGIALAAYCFMGIYERIYVVKASFAAIVPNLDSADGGAMVEATFSYDNAVKLAKDMEVVISIPAHDIMQTGKVTEIMMNDTGAEDSKAKVYIVPQNPIPTEWIRLPVTVKIDTR